MRLDKFLKNARLVKRRTLAKEVADQGRIQINGHAGKAASKLQVGDELRIRFGQKVLTIEVKELKETVRKEDAADLYVIKHEEPVNKD